MWTPDHRRAADRRGLRYPSDLTDDEWVRWSRFLRQAVKVDLMTKRMIHHEDTQAVHG